MKRKNIGLMIATLAVVCAGSLALALSVTQIKGSVHEELSENTEVNMEAASIVIEKDEPDSEFTLGYKQDDSIILLERLRLEQAASENEKEEQIQTFAEMVFVYEGLEVSIKDSFLEKDAALADGMRIMDYVFSYVDETIFEPYGIDKTEYEYAIRRQYHIAGGVDYAVFMKKEDRIICTVGIFLKDEPVLNSFARDGLIELCGGELETPEEYLIGNWCETTEKREAIYAEYLEKSKEVVKRLGLPAIKEDIKDVDCISYFNATNGWSTVSFGYVLENGLYVKVFYNRVNQMWDGFVIAGYHQDYYDTAE